MSTLDLLDGDVASLDVGNKLNSLDGIALQPYLIYENLGRLLCHAFLLFVCKCKFFCHK